MLSRDVERCSTSHQLHNPIRLSYTLYTYASILVSGLKLCVHPFNLYHSEIKPWIICLSINYFVLRDEIVPLDSEVESWAYQLQRYISDCWKSQLYGVVISSYTALYMLECFVLFQRQEWWINRFAVEVKSCDWSMVSY